jgi:hypothetical protein
MSEGAIELKREHGRPECDAHLRRVEMRKTLVLSSALALLMGIGVAYAGSNDAYMDQQGSYNNASINQSDGTNNKAGSAAHAITQIHNDAYTWDTHYNTLSIVQSGNSNDVGLGTNSNPFGYGYGIYQNEDYTNGGNSPEPSQRNYIGIMQTSNGNSVGAISQYTATHAGDNYLSISQSGNGGNRVGSVSQQRTQANQNIAIVNQSGTGNTIASMQQYTVNISNGANKMYVTQSGNNNGNGHLTGAAAATGAQSSTLIQGAPFSGGAVHALIDSYASLDISGNNNQFGITQLGHGYNDSDSVGSVLISGNSNQLGIYQEGNGNVVALAEISGTSNNIGIQQTGDGNLATVIVDQSGNKVYARQNDNDNQIYAKIDGNNNGTGLFSDGGASTLASSNGLFSGDLFQDTGNQSMTLKITGNSNQFAFLQTDGTLNTINATITGGSNQAVGVQDGSSNAATLTQGGNSNVAVFHQVGGSNVSTIKQ